MHVLLNFLHFSTYRLELLHKSAEFNLLWGLYYQLKLLVTLLITYRLNLDFVQAALVVKLPLRGYKSDIELLVVVFVDTAFASGMALTGELL